MSKEFLERLFWACSDETEHYAVGMNLGEFYEKSGEIKHGWDCLAKAVDDLGLGPKDRDKVSSIAYTLTDAFEKQGFINGFRLGMKLAGELGEGAVV